MNVSSITVHNIDGEQNRILESINSFHNPYTLKPSVLAASAYTIKLFQSQTGNKTTQILMKKRKKKESSKQGREEAGATTQIDLLLSNKSSANQSSIDRFYIHTMVDASIRATLSSSNKYSSISEIHKLWSRVDITYQSWVSNLTACLIRIYLDEDSFLKTCETLCLLEQQFAADIFPIVLSNILRSFHVKQDQTLKNSFAKFQLLKEK